MAVLMCLQGHQQRQRHNVPTTFCISAAMVNMMLVVFLLLATTSSSSSSSAHERFFPSSFASAQPIPITDTMRRRYFTKSSTTKKSVNSGEDVGVRIGDPTEKEREAHQSVDMNSATAEAKKPKTTSNASPSPSLSASPSPPSLLHTVLKEGHAIGTSLNALLSDLAGDKEKGGRGMTRRSSKGQGRDGDVTASTTTASAAPFELARNAFTSVEQCAMLMTNVTIAMAKQVSSWGGKTASEDSDDASSGGLLEVPFLYRGGGGGGGKTTSSSSRAAFSSSSSWGESMSASLHDDGGLIHNVFAETGIGSIAAAAAAAGGGGGGAGKGGKGRLEQQRAFDRLAQIQANALLGVQRRGRGEGDARVGNDDASSNTNNNNGGGGLLADAVTKLHREVVERQLDAVVQNQIEKLSSASASPASALLLSANLNNNNGGGGNNGGGLVSVDYNAPFAAALDPILRSGRHALMTPQQQGQEGGTESQEDEAAATYASLAALASLSPSAIRRAVYPKLSELLKDTPLARGGGEGTSAALSATEGGREGFAAVGAGTLQKGSKGSIRTRRLSSGDTHDAEGNVANGRNHDGGDELNQADIRTLTATPQFKRLFGNSQQRGRERRRMMKKLLRLSGDAQQKRAEEGSEDAAVAAAATNNGVPTTADPIIAIVSPHNTGEGGSNEAHDVGVDDNDNDGAIKDPKLEGFLRVDASEIPIRIAERKRKRRQLKGTTQNAAEGRRQQQQLAAEAEEVAVRRIRKGIHKSATPPEASGASDQRKHKKSEIVTGFAGRRRQQADSDSTIVVENSEANSATEDIAAASTRTFTAQENYRPPGRNVSYIMIFSDPRPFCGEGLMVIRDDEKAVDGGDNSTLPTPSSTPLIYNDSRVLFMCEAFLPNGTAVPLPYVGPDGQWIDDDTNPNNKFKWDAKDYQTNYAAMLSIRHPFTVAEYKFNMTDAQRRTCMVKASEISCVCATDAQRVTNSIGQEICVMKTIGCDVDIISPTDENCAPPAPSQATPKRVKEGCYTASRYDEAFSMVFKAQCTAKALGAEGFDAMGLDMLPENNTEDSLLVLARWRFDEEYVRPLVYGFDNTTNKTIEPNPEELFHTTDLLFGRNYVELSQNLTFFEYIEPFVNNTVNLTRANDLFNDTSFAYFKQFYNFNHLSDFSGTEEYDINQVNFSRLVKVFNGRELISQAFDFSKMKNDGFFIGGRLYGEVGFQSSVMVTSAAQIYIEITDPPRGNYKKPEKRVSMALVALVIFIALLLAAGGVYWFRGWRERRRAEQDRKNAEEKGRNALW